ncbi:histidine kinase [Salinisphaera aquimarina]
MISVTAMLAVILLAATAIVVANAHGAIADEMHSSVTLASDIIEASLTAGEDGVSAAHRLDEIGHLRHLCVSLIQGHSEEPSCPSKPVPTAPAWFTAITRPDTLPERRIRVAPDLQIRILADPEDEIDETWHDTRGLIGLLLVFYAAILAIVYLLMGRAMVPVRRIDAALQRIEHGDYAIRLPRFSLPEFDGIAAHFNHMAETLATTRDENHRLRDHSLQIQEDERRNLARELHDELGQSLTAIRADAAGILARGDTLPAGVPESARAIADVAARIYDQAHLMMRRLRPPGLDELGLAAALEEHVAGWQRSRPDIVFVFDCDGDDDIAPAVAIHVFRLIQEALTNALRHAHAQRIRVELAIGDDRLDVCVVDDGHGFDTLQRAPGLGLSGMHERIELLGGRLRISSGARKGTRIDASIPLTAEAS